MEPEQHDGGGRTLTEQEYLIEAPLLRSLESRLKECTDLKDWAILRAQQALYLARTHRIADAVSVPGEIRKRFVGQHDPEVFFWVWLLEGVLAFYRTGTTAGMGFLNRANAVAGVLGRVEYLQYVAAWAAHFCFTDDKYEEMVRWLCISGLDKAALPEAACRASLVSAVAWQTAGNNKRACYYFGRSRDIARGIGDRATIMASITNRGTIRLNHIWIENFFRNIDATELGDIERDLVGGLAYETVTGSEALGVQAQIFRMRIAYIRREYRQAFEHLTSALKSHGHQNYSIIRTLPILGVWLNMLLTGPRTASLADFTLPDCDVKSMDLDDAMVSLKVAGEIAEHLGDNLQRDSLIRRAESLYLEYRSLSGKLVAAL